MTLVTALVRDPAGNPYVNALVEASFLSNIPAGTGTGPPLASGSVFQTFAVSETDSFGNLSMSLTDLAAITPSGGSWNFNVLNNARTIGFALNTTLITGASVDISAALQAASAPLNPSVGFGNITVTGITDTGALSVTGTSTLGVATATSVNKVTFTPPATGATVTILDGKTAKVDNTLEFAGTDGTKMTFPSTNASIARTDAGQTFTGVQVLPSPTINGTPTGTGIPTVTLKKGTNAGNYATSSVTAVQVDGTNLTYTVTIPTGWKLTVVAAGSAQISTATATVTVIIADGGSSVQTVIVDCPNVGKWIPWTLAWAITGDGNSHTVDLRFLTSNAADAANIANSAGFVPSMLFMLTPSN